MAMATATATAVDIYTIVATVCIAILIFIFFCSSHIEYIGYMGNVEVNNATDALYNQSIAADTKLLNAKNEPEKIYVPFSNEDIIDLTFSTDYSY